MWKTEKFVGAKGFFFHKNFLNIQNFYTEKIIRYFGRTFPQKYFPHSTTPVENSRLFLPVFARRAAMWQSLLIMKKRHSYRQELILAVMSRI